LKIITSLSLRFLDFQRGECNKYRDEDGKKQDLPPAPFVIVNHSSEILSKQLQHHDSQSINLIKSNDKQAFTDLLYDIFALAICESVDKLTAIVNKDQHDFSENLVGD
ncbi:MAG: hypothetical protein KAH20_01945, partial [Methylococcales bacterium]|nr:hypothetical protein [Methylococcales bacterium]